MNPVLWMILAASSCAGLLTAQSVDKVDFETASDGGLRALEARRLDEAVALFERGLALRPRDAISAYNLVCAYSLKRQFDQAIAWFEKAADWGYENIEHAGKDTDLDNLRDQPGYQAVIRRIQARLSMGVAGRAQRARLNPEVGTELIVMLRSRVATGAGIIFGREKNRLYIATARHVVRRGGVEPEDAEIQIKQVPGRWHKARLMPPLADAELDAAVVVAENLGDLDMCKVNLELLGDTKRLQRGEPAYPVGYPNGILWAMPLTPNRVSGIAPGQISFESEFIRVGFSGGGLLNRQGEVIGMIAADEPPLGRAIPIDLVLDAARKAGYPVQISSPVGLARRPLHLAAAAGNAAEVRRLLSECADPNAADELGKTPLHEAALSGSAEAVKLLLNAGGRMNAWSLMESERDRRRWGNALHSAAKAGSVEAVKAFLDRGADIDLRTLSKYEDRASVQAETPLHLAVKRDSVEVAAVLMAAGADVSAKAESGLTPLHFAAMSRSGKIAEMLLRKGARHQDQVPNEGSPLHLAAEFNAADVARQLIAHGAGVDKAREHFDETPLHRAAQHGSAETAEVLLSHKANVNAKGYLRRTPLHLAVEKKSAPAVRVILAHGADVNAADERGNSPLMFAVENGNLEIMQQLIGKKADTAFGRPLTLALKKRNTEAVRMLLEAGSDVTADIPLHLAAASGLTEAVKLLLKAGASASRLSEDEKATPLHDAAEKGHVDVVELLLGAGAPLNAKDRSGRTALYRAAYEGKMEVVRRLLRAGADPNIEAGFSREPDTPLARAAQRGDTPAELVALLLKAGANPNLKRGEPLHSAAANYDAEKIRLLLAAGAPVDTRDEYLWTPLHESLRHLGDESRLLETVRVLIKAGTDVNALDERENTPLHLAMANQAPTPEVIQLLLASGARVNARNKSKRTPLHVVVGAERPQEDRTVAAARLLIGAGADVNAQDESGATPLDLAEREKLDHVRKLLVAHGARSGK